MAGQAYEWRVAGRAWSRTGLICSLYAKLPALSVSMRAKRRMSLATPMSGGFKDQQPSVRSHSREIPGGLGEETANVLNAALDGIRQSKQGHSTNVESRHDSI